jgi:glycosyltransferase involved in cell wall biosynthesis
MVLDREFPPDKRVENEIDALLNNGHDVHIACFTQHNKANYEKRGRLTIYRKPVSTFIYKSSVACLTLPFYFNFWKKFLHDILKNQVFDAIHVHDLPLVRVGAKLKNEFRTKLIADLHENWPALLLVSKHTNTLLGRLLSPIYLWRIYEKRVLKKADAIIVVVEEAKSRVIKLGIPEEKIFIVSNTINHEELAIGNITKPHKEIILFYAGGINHHRGLHNIIAAMHHAGNSSLKFWIVGDGSYKDALVQQIKNSGLQDQVEFFGFQPFLKMMELMQQSDFALIPHLKTEHTDSTIPNKIFQYMYAGKPVIASDCLPIKRILEETGAGFVYPAENIVHLSEIFNSLYKTDVVKMAENGRKAVVEKYNWSHDSKVLVRLYEGI